MAVAERKTRTSGYIKPKKPASLPYMPGLDGLRAIAVFAVLFYHAGLSFFGGGFLGVEVFFVISGFLITTLLLTEHDRTGLTNLRAFWWRRAKRLLPALFVFIIAVLFYSIIFLPDEVASLRGDVAAAFAYITNWHLIFSQKSYFEQIGRPPLLRHLWSLAVEEQFYIFFPLVFSFMMAWWRRIFGVVIGLAALGSTVLMALIYQPDIDPSRVYYGTDTRAAGLLVGVLLALIWASPRGREFQARGNTLLLNIAGIAALATLTCCFIFVDQFGAFLYRGGFALVSISTAVLIATTIHASSWLARGLGWRPLVWLGQRSYSIYLWHWAVFCLTRPQLDLPLDGVPLFALRLALTLGLAELSYRYIETPIRDGALEKLWQKWQQARGAERQQLSRTSRTFAVIGSLVTAVVFVSLVSAKVPPAPAGYSAPPVVVAVATPTPTPTPIIVPTLAPTATPPVTVTLPAIIPPTATFAPQPTVPKAPAPTVTPTATAKPTATPKPAPPLTAVGDSVLLGSANSLREVVGPFIYEADVGLQAKSGVDVLRAFKNKGQLGGRVLVHLGTNGYFSDKSFDEIMALAGNERQVYFVNVRVPREWQNANNKVLAEGVRRYPNAHLIDWYARSAGHPEYFTNDGVHLTSAGIRVYVGLIGEQI
jgi:peptidoglycan/LPS O-acetylase OafA/YrhL